MAINLLERLGGPFFPEWLIFFAEGNSSMFFAGGKNISAKNIKYLTVLAIVFGIRYCFIYCIVFDILRWYTSTFIYRCASLLSFLL
jgi:hypothetical protein